MVEYLHKNGIIVGDVSASNFLIKSDTEIYLIDTDSFQVDNLPCTVHTVLFTPPELQGKDFRSFIRKKAHDYATDYFSKRFIWVAKIGMAPYFPDR